MDSKVIIGRFPVIDLASKGVPGNFTCPGPAQLQARPCGVSSGCSVHQLLEPGSCNQTRDRFTDTLVCTIFALNSLQKSSF